MSENQGMILTLVLSLGILWGFHFITNSQHTAQLSQNAESISQYVNTIPTTTPSPQTSAKKPREQILANQTRLPIRSDKLAGSINLEGAQIDDLTLLDYPETTEPGSKPVVLLNPKDSATPYYAQIVWHGTSGTPNMPAEDFPNENTKWTVVNAQAELTPLSPVTLRWANPEGIVFERTFAIDNRYMLTVSDVVLNHSGKTIKISAEKRLVRSEPAQTRRTTSVHEGGIGYFNDTLKELRYEKFQAGKTLAGDIQDGWAGFTDKYWLTAFVVKDSLPSQVAIEKQGDLLSCSIRGAEITLNEGDKTEYKTMFFSGAKVLKDLDQYSVTHGIKKFDLAVDFGWLYFLTKPLFYLLQFFYHLVHNLGIAIIILTVLSKIISYPLAKSSYSSMARMKDVQPKIEMIKKRYKDDKVKINEEMLKLYKNNKINPMSGCLPLLIQMPIFFCLYKVFTISIEMRHAPFMLWIKDLSAPDPTCIFNLFGLIPWTPPAVLQIGILPIIMAGTMLLQQKLSPQPTDPTQAKMMYIMPLVFLFMFSAFPSGLVLYWTVSNILAIGQQMMMRKQQVAV